MRSPLSSTILLRNTRPASLREHRPRFDKTLSARSFFARHGTALRWCCPKAALPCTALKAGLEAGSLCLCIANRIACSYAHATRSTAARCCTPDASDARCSRKPAQHLQPAAMATERWYAKGSKWPRSQRNINIVATTLLASTLVRTEGFLTYVQPAQTIYQ
jgi:hypothetical protein